MEYFLISLLDPIMVVPAFLVGCFTSGPLRLWIAGIMLAAYPAIAMGYGVPTPAADALIGRALAAGFVVLVGVAVSRLRAGSKEAARRAD